MGKYVNGIGNGVRRGPTNRELDLLEMEEQQVENVSCCANDLCNRRLLPVQDSDGKCSECGEDMYDIADLELEEVTDDSPDTNFDIISERLFEEAKRKSRFSADISSRAVFPQLQGNTNKVQPVSDTFSCPSDLTGCPVAGKPVVYIPKRLFDLWIFLAQQIDTEWIAYLKGHEVEGEPNAVEITDMYFPKQTATGTHVTAADGEIQPDTIAAVHSHVGMGVFFSGEDIAHFNHRIELVVNRKGEIKANGRVRLECGRFHRGDADVEFIQLDQEIEQLALLEAQITEEKNTTFTVTHGHHSNHNSVPAGFVNTTERKSETVWRSGAARTGN